MDCDLVALLNIQPDQRYYLALIIFTKVKHSHYFPIVHPSPNPHKLRRNYLLKARYDYILIFTSQLLRATLPSPYGAKWFAEKATQLMKISFSPLYPSQDSNHFPHYHINHREHIPTRCTHGPVN